jgi:hypothetical protein
MRIRSSYVLYALCLLFAFLALAQKEEKGQKGEKEQKEERHAPAAKKKIETPCPGGELRVRHAYSECQADGFWHVVEDDYYVCPPEGKIEKFRVWDEATTQVCKPGQRHPQVAKALLKDLHGDASCQSPKKIGDITISDCVDGFWENTTYPLFECLDGTRRISLPGNAVKTSVACTKTPPPPEEVRHSR